MRINKSQSLIIFVLFIFGGQSIAPIHSAQAQVLNLPVPGVMVELSSAYVPVLMKGVKIHADNPMLLDFILDNGHSGLLADDPKLKEQSEKLIKYFLAAVTIPENDLWVNLSPYEKNRIVPSALGKTEMGRDMLAQDYVLKQLAASLIYPEKHLGKKFWDRVYAQVNAKFGINEVPVNTFNKVWILPDVAQVYEHNNTAYILKSRLKVMLQEDYEALRRNTPGGGFKSSLTSQIVREVVIPALETEVNEGRNFAPLRQIYHSLIMGVWYKNTLKNAFLNQVYANKGKIDGVDLSDRGAAAKIYRQYLAAYKKGVFNYIKEDIDHVSHQAVPRKYFSGGEVWQVSQAMTTVHALTAPLLSPVGQMFDVQSLQLGVGPSVSSTVNPVILPIGEPFFVLNRTRIDGTSGLEKFLAKADSASISAPVAGFIFGKIAGWWSFYKSNPFRFTRAQRRSIQETVMGDKRTIKQGGQEHIYWANAQLNILFKIARESPDLLKKLYDWVSDPSYKVSRDTVKKLASGQHVPIRFMSTSSSGNQNRVEAILEQSFKEIAQSALRQDGESITIVSPWQGEDEHPLPLDQELPESGGWGFLGTPRMLKNHIEGYEEGMSKILDVLKDMLDPAKEDYNPVLFNKLYLAIMEEKIDDDVLSLLKNLKYGIIMKVSTLNMHVSIPFAPSSFKYKTTVRNTPPGIKDLLRSAVRGEGANRYLVSPWLGDSEASLTPSEAMASVSFKRNVEGGINFKMSPTFIKSNKLPGNMETQLDAAMMAGFQKGVYSGIKPLIIKITLIHNFPAFINGLKIN